jgi:hypothetical protein
MPATPQSESSEALKRTINEEEARTELRATLSAARELGPDMDATLASRYVERLDVLFPDKTRDSARLRRDVEALIVSARGHSADADAARVDDFVKSVLAVKPAQPAPLAPMPQPNMPYEPARQPSPAVIAPVAIVAIIAYVWMMVQTGGEWWWLIFFLPGLIWGISGGRRGRGRGRRYYRRYGYWDGYGPNMPAPNPDANRQLPPSDGSDWV